MNELDFVLSNPCLEKKTFTEKKVTAIQSWANFGKITQTKLKKHVVTRWNTYYRFLKTCSRGKRLRREQD